MPIGTSLVLAVVNVVLPVFAIIVLGYGAVRFKLFPADGTKGLVLFVNNFATPCLLFSAMLDADFGATFNPGIIVPFYVGALVSLFVGGWISRKVFGKRPGESVSSGFAAMFTNTVLIGIPLVSRAYGEPALAVAYSIIAFHAPFLITLGMLVMELARRDGDKLSSVLVTAGKRMLSNPLLWAVGLGVIANLARLEVTGPPRDFLVMMSQAVLPASLFGLGGALNEYKLTEGWQEALTMTLFKLMIHPAIAFVLMVYVMRVPLEVARYGVLLAGMPTGINAYIFATYYNRGVGVANSTILLTTALSVLTISFWLVVLGHN